MWTSTNVHHLTIIELEFTHTRLWFTVPKFVTVVALGVAFLHANGPALGFTQTPVPVCHASVRVSTPSPTVSAVLGDTQATASMVEDPEYSVPHLRDCRVFNFQDSRSRPPGTNGRVQGSFPDRSGPDRPGQPLHPHHKSLVRVPSWRVPAQYREKTDRQLEEMLQLGIITESNSPWMAPAVYIRKKCWMQGVYSMRKWQEWHTCICQTFFIPST